MVEILNYLFAGTVCFSHIFGYVFSIASLFFIYKNWQYLKQEKILLFMISFVAYGFVLSIFVENKHRAFDEMFTYLTSWITPFILGYYITDTVKKEKILSVNILLFLTIVIFSIFAYYGLIGKKFFTLDFVRMNHLNAFIHHISCGAMCVCMSSILMTYLFFKENLGKRIKIFLFVALIIFVMALFLTGSRGYYIAGFITYLSIFIFYYFKTKKIKLLAVFVLCAAAVISILYLTNPYMQKRMHDTSITKEESLTIRIRLYKAALDIFKDNILFGIGPKQNSAQTEYFKKYFQDYTDDNGHLHSIYLNILAEFGSVGFIMFIGVLFFIFKRLICVYRRTGSLLALAFIFCWISFCIGDCFDTVMRGPRVSMDYFWMTGLVLGGTLKLKTSVKEKVTDEKK